MGLFVRAVVYGFGFSLGAALYKRISDQLGLEESKSEPKPVAVENATGDSPVEDGTNPQRHS